MTMHSPSALSTMPAIDQTWGVDKIRVSFAVSLEDCNPDSSLWTSIRRRKATDSFDVAEDLSGHFEVGAATVHVDLYSRSSNCHIDFNPSRLLGGGPADICPAGAATRAVELAIQHVASDVWPSFAWVDFETGEIVWDEDWRERVRVKELHLARNIHVADAELVKTAITAILGRGQRVKDVKESRHGGWTVSNKTASVGEDMLYNKLAQMADTGADDAYLSQFEGGLLRFEARLKRDRLKSNGLERLADVDDDGAWSALAARWDATRWGDPLPGTGDTFRATAHLKPYQQASLIGFLHLAAAGRDSIFTDSQLRDLRKRARECGLTPGLPVAMLGDPEEYMDLAAGALLRL